jgi:hypothetical protein
MSPLEIVIVVYGVAVLALVWRNTVLCNRKRAEVLVLRGTKLTFTSFIPLILNEAFFWPVHIFWRGAKKFLEELE